MSNTTESEVLALEASIIRTIQANYYVYAVLTLYIHHYVTTFPQELQVIWCRRFTRVSLLSILNRYIPFIMLTLQLLSNSPIWELNQHEQIVWFLVFECIEGLVSASLPALRVYAIWGQSWKCFSVVAVLGVINVVFIAVPNIPSVVYSYWPLMDGCWYSQLPFIDSKIDNIFAIMSLSTMIALDVLVLVLTWARTYDIRKLAANAGVKTQVSSLLLRDGSVHFGALTVANIVFLITYVIPTSVPVSISVGLDFTQLVIQNMLLSHLMFNLHEAYLTDSSGGGSSLAIGSRQMTSLRFTANIVGNLGAPLTETWFEDADEEQQPSPVICNDPFAFDLIKDEAMEPTTMLQDAAASISLEPEPDVHSAAVDNEEITTDDV